MMDFITVCLTVFAFLVVNVNGYPGHGMKDPMEGGPMNETHPMNMTDMEGMMHPNKESMEPVPSKESEESSRSRRGVVDDMESAGKGALTKVETAGKSAVDTAKNLGKEGMDTIESAGNTVVTGAKNAWKKAEDAI